jgi:hypothetical protein
MGGGAGKGTAGPHRHVDGGAVRAHGIDGGAVKATAPRLTGGVGDGVVQTASVDNGAARVARRGGDGRGRSASVVCASDTRSRERKAVVGGAHGDDAVGRWLSGRRRAVLTAPLRRGARRGVERAHGSHAAMAC